MLVSVTHISYRKPHCSYPRWIHKSGREPAFGYAADLQQQSRETSGCRSVGGQSGEHGQEFLGNEREETTKGKEREEGCLHQSAMQT